MKIRLSYLPNLPHIIAPKTKWRISPDRGNNPHGGSTWKLIDSKNKRVGTISEDGLFLRD